MAKKEPKKPRKAKALPEQNEEKRSLADLVVPALTKDQVVAFINEAAGGEVIQVADQSGNPFLLRRPFHIADIDSQTFGGPPSGGTTQICGPDGVGKNALCWRAIAACQKIYGAEASIGWCWLELPPDKGHALINGACVPWSEDELLLEEQRRHVAGLSPLSAVELDTLTKTIGAFYIMDGGTAEARLEATAQLIAANCCQLVIVDSISSATTHYRMETSLENEPKQAATALMLSEFQKKCWGFFSSPLRGRFNFTSLLIIGQVRTRQKTGVGAKARFQKDYEDNSPRAIRHGKLLDLMLSYGSHIPEQRPYQGKWIPWEVVKAKAGSHEGFKGQVPYFYETGFDIHHNLVMTADHLGLVIKRGKEGSAGCDLIDAGGNVILERAPWGTGGSRLMTLLSELYAQDDALVGAWGQLYRAVLNKRNASCLHYL